MAQINLWGPVFPVEAGATMVIWPAPFGQPVPNTSAEWDQGVADGEPLALP